MTDRMADELRDLADLAQVRPLDVDALREQLRRARRRRRAAVGGAVVLAAAAVVPGVDLLRDRGNGDRLATAAGEPSYLLVVPQEREFFESGELPAEAEACLTEEAVPVPDEQGFGPVFRLTGTAEQRAEVTACLTGVDEVLALPQTALQHLPVQSRRDPVPVLTPEQASRPGVDASAECGAPGVRESAPPFEGEQPIAAASFVAGYLTDVRGHLAWQWEFDGTLQSGILAPPDGLVRLCWYQGGGEYQLVVNAIDGDVPNSNARGRKPIAVLAPPPPRSLSAEEVERRQVVFPQPEGVEVRER